MDQHRTTTLQPTLDPQRTDQLRTFLTVEAAADAASTPTRSPHRGRRRLAGGIAAAMVLGGGLFAAAAIAGGPSSGPASVQTANAVAIEQSAPGWTKISIADIDADPDAVVAELQAAGIDARRESLAVQRDAEGGVTLNSFDDSVPTDGGFTMVGIAEAGNQGLAGLTVSGPDAMHSPIIEDLPEDAEASISTRFGTDGSIEIRHDADVTIIVLTED